MYSPFAALGGMLLGVLYQICQSAGIERNGNMGCDAGRLFTSGVSAAE